MIVLSGADLVLPDRMLPAGTLTIDGDRIAGITSGTGGLTSSGDLHGHYILPGFIDVHLHGVAGADTLDDGDPLAVMAAELPRFGVTAFCPTTMACMPEALASVLTRVKACRDRPSPGSARVLSAHIESGFINPGYRGAQPLACLTDAPRELLRVMDRFPSTVAIVTLAPELEGALDLITRLSAQGIRVSLGHSGATYEQARAAIEAGATQATHFYNCMPPMHHRTPGLAGAVLESDRVTAEIIGDGVHVHPSVVRWTVSAKGASRMMAITDGTAVMGLPEGRQAQLGGQPAFAREGACRLNDGTLAGGVVTMDGVFRTLVKTANVSIRDAALMCATTPARQLGLGGFGSLTPGHAADLVVLDRAFSVVRTYVGGRVAYPRST